jgi:hypothetical protein
MHLALIVAAATSVGGWTVTEQRDPITDRTEVSASLEGDNAKLVFMCSAGTRSVLVYQPAVFLGGRGSSYELRDFVYRFDDGQPQRDSWKYLDAYATPYSEKAARAFTTRMLDARRLVVRAERYDRGTVDSAFDLTGSSKALGQAYSACGVAFP